MDDPVAALLLALTDAGGASTARLRDDSVVRADPLGSAIDAFLSRSDGRDVYASPEGFEAFIDHGSNPALYDTTIAEVSRLQDRWRPTVVADLGCGDGRVTEATTHDEVGQIHLIEPSAELLERALARTGWPVVPTPHPTTVAGWLDGLDSKSSVDLVQSTFALHTFPHDDRSTALRRLAEVTERLVIVDFDVPDFADRSEAHARYAAAAYRRAIEEYAAVPAAIDGFLLPVLVGQFTPGGDRVTFEQSCDRWAEQVGGAGFAVTIRPIHDFWWAPAFVLEATAG